MKTKLFSIVGLVGVAVFFTAISSNKIYAKLWWWNTHSNTSTSWSFWKIKKPSAATKQNNTNAWVARGYRGNFSNWRNLHSTRSTKSPNDNDDICNIINTSLDKKDFTLRSTTTGFIHKISSIRCIKLSDENLDLDRMYEQSSIDPGTPDNVKGRFIPYPKDAETVTSNLHVRARNQYVNIIEKEYSFGANENSHENFLHFAKLALENTAYTGWEILIEDSDGSSINNIQCDYSGNTYKNSNQNILRDVYCLVHRTNNLYLIQMKTDTTQIKDFKDESPFILLYTENTRTIPNGAKLFFVDKDNTLQTFTYDNQNWIETTNTTQTQHNQNEEQEFRSPIFPWNFSFIRLNK